MDNLDDLEDDRWWKRLLTRWDNVPATRKKWIVRGFISVGTFLCWALLRILAGVSPWGPIDVT